MGRKIPDTPKHLALLCWLLLSDVLSFYPRTINKILKGLVGQKLPPIEHVDSKKNKKVNVADMVAGAVLAKESGKGEHFYEIFKEQIISETKINWPEAKRKLFTK